MAKKVWKIIASRLLQTVVVLVGISFLTFLLIHLSPGDPVRSMYAASGSMPSDEIIEQTRETLGLNKPFITQYFSWLLKCLHGDFGTSYLYSKPVLELLKTRLASTLKLTLLAIAVMLVISLPLGIFSATHRGGIADYLVRLLSFFGVSMPNFWIALLLLYVFGVQLKLLPVVSSGKTSVSYVLPVATLAFGMAASYTRQVRTAFLEELEQEYVTGARCRGIKESIILWKHVLPNAFLPLITMLGLSMGALLGGTTAVEVIFSYPGLGSLATKCITAMDYNVIQAYVLWTALIYMIVNLAVDISYTFLDPRIREGK